MAVENRFKTHKSSWRDMDFRPDEKTQDGSVIYGDDWSVSCLHTPGHTSNHICFSWDKEKVLSPGDQVMGWSTSIVSPDGDMGDYMRSLDKLIVRDDKIYYPAHGPETEPQKLISLFKIIIGEENILECLKLGNDTIDQMVKTFTRCFESLHAAAARSLFATVIYLVEQKKVEAIDGLDIDGRYVLI